jgi:carboxylesterase
MIWQAIVIGLGVIALALVYLAVRPPSFAGLESHPRPAAGYAEAVQRVEAIQAPEATGHNPLCHTQLLTHGETTRRAVAFIHGYTNCPLQFLTLGQQFHDLGYNVLILLMPHHGLEDRMTDAHRQLTAEELTVYVDEMVDIARGLGEHVTLVGLSGGAVVAAWAAQTRPDLDRAVVMAPAFAFKRIPRATTVLVTNLALLAPDVLMWWDPIHKDAGRIAHVYPRFSFHGLAQQLRLGFATIALARRAAPGARSILVITNAHDGSVNNGATADVVADWRAHGARDVRTYEFPAELGLEHDMVDPGQPYQKVAAVYPKLIELINE